MAKIILLTGGTGMIGTRLSELLILKGYNVAHLSRSPGNGKIKTYLWNVEKKIVDEKAIAEADYIIHLAGTNVFEKRWTAKFKEEILDSRVNSGTLLYEKIKTVPGKIKAFISASGIGIYGDDTGTQLLNEESKQGNDFLSGVVKQWEATSDLIKNLHIRTVKIRIGIVLSPTGGALEKMVVPIKLGAGSPLGSGLQILSWIHLDDLCNIFIKAVDDEKMEGVYNAVSPQPVSNAQITHAIAGVLQRPLILPSVPSFALQLILGKEKAAIVLGGNNVSSKKIQDAGFHFNFPSIEEALNNILKN